MTIGKTTNLLRAASAALALALAPGRAAAAPAAARAAPARYSDAGQLAAGVALGFGVGDVTTLFKVNGEVQYTVSQISPTTSFDLAGHLGLGFGSSAFLFEALPKARFRYSVDGRLSLYGDGGIGFALWHVTAPDIVTPFGTLPGASTDTPYALVRFAGGIQYKVSPSVILVGEPLGLNIYFGSGSVFQYSLMLGALFRT